MLINAFEKLDRGQTFISVVTLFELLNRKINQDTVEILISSAEILNFDELCSRKASKINMDLQKTGKTVDFRDIFIAATAIVNNCELATLNRKDFENINGLKLLEL